MTNNFYSQSVLRATKNEYPDWYAEYKLKNLKISIRKYDINAVKKLTEDIKERGLIYPIIIYSPYKNYQVKPNFDVNLFNDADLKKIFNVWVGNKRIIAATQLGYTDISVYHVTCDEDVKKLCGHTYLPEFST
jgi:hypothetical protein